MAILFALNKGVVVTIDNRCKQIILAATHACLAHSRS